jgi:hypothetical protein
VGRNGCLGVAEETDWRNMVAESGSHRGHVKATAMKPINMACGACR